METVISGLNLFSPGTANKFKQIGKCPELAKKVAKVIEQGKPIGDAHLLHRPNMSFESTEKAACSGDFIVNGMKREEIIKDSFFGSNIRESINTIKTFLHR